MTPQPIVANEIVTLDDLKGLARAAGPCITITAQIATPPELATRLKNAARAVEKALAKWKLDSAARESLLEPICNLTQTAEVERMRANALIFFRSPAVFQYFPLRRREPEVESVGDRFQARPLFATLAREQRFHLLALSRKRIRLLDYTSQRAQEVTLQGFAPDNFHSWMSLDQPDHLRENRSTSGPSTGSMKGAPFGTGDEREHEKRSLAHFFKAVDEGVNKLLHENTRLLLIGVEEELAIYQRVTVFPRLFKNTVHGAPEALSDAELHQRAMKAAVREPSALLERSLSHFQKHRNDNRLVVSNPKQMIQAAWEGRVSDLFIREGAEYTGTFNEQTLEVDVGNPREDLLNAAALATVTHGGQAFVLDRDEMPVPGDAGAVLRF